MTAQRIPDGARPDTNRTIILIQDAFLRAAAALAQKEREVLQGEARMEPAAVRLLRDMDGVVAHNRGERLVIVVRAEGALPVGFEMKQPLSWMEETLWNTDEPETYYGSRGEAALLDPLESVTDATPEMDGLLVHVLAKGADRYARSTRPPVTEAFEVFWKEFGRSLAEVPCSADFHLVRDSRSVDSKSLAEALQGVRAALTHQVSTVGLDRCL